MRTHSDVLEPVVLALCEEIDTPRSLAVWLCYKYSQQDLLDLSPVQVATNDSAKYAADYFITEYLSKYKGLRVGVNTKQVAISKWRLAEIQCQESNARLKSYLSGKVNPLYPGAEAHITTAQRKIQAVLGRLSLASIMDRCKWGPGATFDMKREVATRANKISKPITVTAGALSYMRATIESDPHWFEAITGILPDGPFRTLPSCFSIVRGSRFLTVPKNAKTDRSIAAEPTGNSFLQQGVGRYLRQRLKRFGVDLDDQSLNQRLARRAYTEGFSTLDLSAASDTISVELVYLLLPLDWALFLDALRSPETRVENSWIRTHKFASMGNAFCFELESLIFWALASAVAGDDEVGIFGDDIIVRECFSRDVIRLLAFVGFDTNTKKSHLTGNFFESCGKHYHRAVDVTPIYQKEVINHPSEIIRAHNRIKRLSSRLGFGFRRALRALAAMYPLRPFPRIPEGCVEDGGFLRPLSDFVADPNHGYRCQVLDYVVQLKRTHETAMYAYKLRRPQERNPDKKGYAGDEVGGKWRTRVRYIPFHAIGLGTDR